MSSSIFIVNQEDHAFVLDQYEGPLDLLLSMIKEAKINIKDIFVSKITDQYIDYIRSMEIMDLDKASDFVAMAATLLEIKSNDLLPQIEMLEDNEEYYVDEKQELQRQLEMYSLIQEASQLVQSKETRFRFYREPMFDENDCRLVFAGASIDQLLDAFAKVLHKVEFKLHEGEPKSIEKDMYTVAEKVIYLAELIMDNKEVKFFDLFIEDNSYSAVLNTFLALLELLKRQVAIAVQDKRFGDITIQAKEGAESIDLEDYIDEQSQAHN